MPTRDIAAIDIHAHYGFNDRPDLPALNRSLASADIDSVARRARDCGIRYTAVSPLLALMPRGRADACAGNEEAARLVPETPGMLQWVVVNPKQPATYEQAAELLQRETCVGIKIHPEEHRYPIREHGEAIFSFAASHRAVVLTHSGEANSLPVDFVPFANACPEVTLILAHIGCGLDNDPTLQVRAVQQSRHGNIYTDTSSAQSITPGLIEFAVAELGEDRILFGTDAPLYSTAMQRTRIDSAELTEHTKRLILHDNAMRILRLNDHCRSL